MDKEYVLEQAKAHDVKFVNLWFTDILGYLKSFAITVEELELSLDEGQGFDPTKLPDPTDPANLEMASGRGILLMRTFMDEIKYNDKGNIVTLIKRRKLEED